MSSIELRSDTFTKPTAAMREAMACADVGDDMVGEDPTVNRLEKNVAELLGKEAAVYNCSGTQSNQMAIWAHCERGDEALIESSGHISMYESGAPAIMSGVTVRTINGEAGRLDLEHLAGQIRRDDDHYSPTKLLCLENSTNIGGGRTYSLEQMQRVCKWAKENELHVHLDGARLFNACATRGYSPAEITADCDTVSICFSKGLGCPMGSILVGSKKLIQRARRARKVMGGSLRQAGIVAASAVYAMEHHIDRLQEDHANARRLAEGLAELKYIHLDLASVETNLVFFDVDPAWGSSYELQNALEQRGVLLYAIDKRQRLRACTHLDVSQQQIDEALSVFQDVLAT